MFSGPARTYLKIGKNSLKFVFRKYSGRNTNLFQLQFRKNHVVRCFISRVVVARLRLHDSKLVFCCRNPSFKEGGGFAKHSWPVFTKHGQEYMTLNVKEPAVKRGPRATQCAFWKKYMPQLMSMTGKFCEFSVVIMFNRRSNAGRTTECFRTPLLGVLPAD